PSGLPTGPELSGPVGQPHASAQAVKALNRLTAPRGPTPSTVRRRASRRLVDVAIHAAFNPKLLADRRPRVVGRQPGIEPREVVEDGHGADGLIDDVAAVARVQPLREGAHRARL